MEVLGEYKCRNCDMVFRSLALLDKHREHFCIGSDIGDPLVLKRGQPQFMEPEGSNFKGGPKKAETPNFKKREQKNEQARLQRWRERAEDRDWRSRKEEDPGPAGSDSLTLRKLTEEFHKLRMSIEESMPTLPTWAAEASKEPSPRRPWEQSDRVREMAERHERQLAEIQAHNRQLEQEREEIGRKLAELAGRGNAANLERLLLELQQQEERNEEALQHIQGQIQTLHQQQGAREAGNRPDSPSFGPHEERKTQHMTFDLSSDGDGRLSGQIRALRLAYMQSGGADPVVLAQMHDLQAEAHMLEWAKPRAQLKGGKRRSKPSHRVLDAELLSVEKENQRLEEEILRIRLARERHRGEEAAVGAELQQVQREQIHQMATVQAEIEYLRREVERAKDFPRERRQAPPPPPPPPFPPPPPVLPLDQMPAPPTLEQAGPHNAMQGGPVLDPLESLGPAPYDPGAGFVIFYDLVLGLEATLRTVRLVVGLYAGGHDLGRPTHLPPVPCQPGGGLPYVNAVPAGNYAALSVKQPVPRMQPSSSLALVVEVQAAGGLDPYGQEIQRLVSRGWAQLDLFDAHNQVRSGHWRLPVRALPVRPSLGTAQLNAVPQVGNVELCLRVANARDGDVQSLVNVEPGNAAQYKYPSVVSARPMAFLGNPPPPLTTLKPSANPYLSLLPPTDHVDPPPMEGSNQSEAAAPSHSGPVAGGGGGGAEGGMGVVVDRVKGAPPGEGGLRLTGYSQRTGKVLLFGTSGMLCCTSTVLSSIKHGDFIFGEQRISFCPAEPQEDTVLILRFYHWPGGGGVEPGGLVEQKSRAPWERDGVAGNLTKQEECASAWGVIRLTRPVAPAEQRAAGREVAWNTGTHTVPLYHVPVPPAIALTALPDDSLVKPFAPYGDATARLHIYSGEAPLFPFPPESPLPAHASPEWPQGAYIFRERETPPVRPFLSGDGFDLYIDGARLLPDCVTVSRVTGRIFDRHYNQVGPDISTGIDLNSNIFEPVYDERVEIRCLNMPPSATLLLKLYTVDRFSLRMVLVGWTALGLFVESGSETQPSVDTGALQVSLNEGAHQLRLYHTGPDPDKPLCTKALSSASRRVPCATVLVRVAGVPVDEDGRALSRSQVPEADWGKLGLLLPRPGYSEGGYYSGSARPTPGEASLQSAMSHRSVVLVREITSLIAGTTWGAEPKSDEEISDWIRQKLSRMMDSRPQPINLSMVSRYVSSAGLKVSVDRALNLPWAAFTLGLCTLSPPAAFYHGPSWVSYDRPTILQQLDFNSSQSSPQWSDGFKSFPRRVHHQHLTAIVHLHEVSVRATHNPTGAQSPRGQETLTYSLGKESWAALPIFTRGYCHTAHYQLPLYQGSPSQAALSALAHGECQLVLEDLRLKGQVQLLKGASVFVRVADGRRCEELEQSEDKDRDVSQLPPDQMDSYSPQGNSTPLSQLIPPSYTKDSFASELTAKFTQLVYQTLGTATELGKQNLLQL